MSQQLPVSHFFIISPYIVTSEKVKADADVAKLNCFYLRIDILDNQVHDIFIKPNLEAPWEITEYTDIDLDKNQQYTLISKQIIADPKVLYFSLVLSLDPIYQALLATKVDPQGDVTAAYKACDDKLYKEINLNLFLGPYK